MVGFLLSLLFALSALAGPYWGGWAAFLTPLVALGLFPLLDLFMKPDQAAPVAGPRWFFNAILYLYVLLHLTLIGCGIWLSYSHEFSTLEWIGLTLSVGIVSGAVGVTFAHELIHRRSRFQRLLGEVILVFVGFGHFAVAHVHSHHRFVGTPEDAATAKAGQSIYSFFLQVLPGVFLASFRIKPQRTIIYTLSTVGLALVTYLVFGPLALAFFLAQGLIAILLTETADYVEHYGLVRKKLPDGRYEPVSALHSWDSDRWLTGKVMIHLQRHADHHLHAAKEYHELVLNPKSRQLPTGYPGCLWLALIPPLWRRVMDPKLQLEN